MKSLRDRVPDVFDRIRAGDIKAWRAFEAAVAEVLPPDNPDGSPSKSPFIIDEDTNLNDAP